MDIRNNPFLPKVEIDKLELDRLRRENKRLHNEVEMLRTQLQIAQMLALDALDKK